MVSIEAAHLPLQEGQDVNVLQDELLERGAFRSAGHRRDECRRARHHGSRSAGAADAGVAVRGACGVGFKLRVTRLVMRVQNTTYLTWASPLGGGAQGM